MIIPLWLPINSLSSYEKEYFGEKERLFEYRELRILKLKSSCFLKRGNE